MCSRGDHVAVPGGGDEDVGGLDHILQPQHLVAVHRGLQRADRVDLCDDDASALATQRLGAALADIAIATDDRQLAADEDIGGPVDAVDQRVATAVLIVELGLGDRVIDVDRGEQQVALLCELVQAMNTRGRLLGHAADTGGDALKALRVLVQRAAQELQHDAPFLRVGARRLRHGAGSLVFDPLVDEQGRVAAVVEDHVGALAVWPGESLLGGAPVLLQRLPLPREHRHSARLLRRPTGSNDSRSRGVILGRKDVAGGPAHFRAKRHKCLDQHRSLHGHMQRPSDPCALQRLAVGVLTPHGHEAGHLVFGQADLVAAERRETQVADLKIGGRGGRGGHQISVAHAA